VATKSAEAACAVAATTVAAGTVATTDVPAFPITATIGAARCTVVVAFKQVKNPGQKPRHRFFLTFYREVPIDLLLLLLGRDYVLITC
jgi:hypothetical protein